MHCIQYISPMGPLLLTCDDEGLTGIRFEQELPEKETVHPVLEQTRQWLDAYFRGQELPRQMPLKLQGTEFQKQVWQLLLTVPFGQTDTYGSLARKMAMLTGKEKMSAQAVGQAVGKNPISILIPCHRIVGAGGKLTGYAWGLEKKVWLLEHEKSAGHSPCA